MVPSNHRRYRILRKILPFVGLIILVYILTQLDIPRVLDIFASLNPWYCALAAFSFIPILLLVNIEWQLLLKQQGIHVSFLYSIKNILIGYFYGFITPGGLGGYLQILYLKQESKEPLPKCASNVLTLHTIDLITLLAFAIAGGILIAGRFPIFLALFIILLGITLTLFLLYLKKDSFQPLLQRLLQTRLMRFVQNQFEDPLETFFEGRPSFRAVALPLLFSVIGWIVSFTELYLLSSLFKINVPYLPFILFIAMANVVAILPISIYGLGTREATLISLFSLYGVASEQIVSLSLFWFALIWLLPSIAGAAVTFHEHKKISLLRAQIPENHD